MKAFFRVMTLTLTLSGYGCDAERPSPMPVSPSPTSPTVTTSVQDLASRPADAWRLRTTIVSLEGTMCFWTWPVGKQFDWTLSVDRSGAQVRFVYDINNPHDNLLFVGAVNERSFTAASATYGSSWQCSGSVMLSSSVVGSFSPDGRTLTGRERLTYRRVDGGGELTITYEWSATPTS